jgi:hypothetical protein
MSKVRCGIGDCTYSHALSRVVGKHRFQVHGVPGASYSAKHNREISIQAVATPTEIIEENTFLCTKCDHAPFKSKHGLQYHIQAEHKKRKLVKCRHCPKTFKSTTGRRHHETKQHPKMGRPILEAAPLFGTRAISAKKRTMYDALLKKGTRLDTSHKTVSLTEAIQVLQHEIDARLDVIAKLRVMNGE